MGFGPGGGRGFGPGGGRGFGPRGPWAGRGRGPWAAGPEGDRADLPDAGDAAAWFAGRLPDGWFLGAPSVEIDDDEILVVGRLAAPEVAEGSGGPTSAASEGRAARFREDTRRERIGIARQAQERYGRTVSWGVSIDGTEYLFTHLEVRGVVSLSRPQRRQIDQLVTSGAAASRSAALSAALDFALAHSAEWAQASEAGTSARTENAGAAE